MLIRGDARWLPLRDACVDCVVTSPPYFGLRDYGHARQIGLEETPQLYLDTLVCVFTEVWRVLKNCGTVWLNLADSYNSSTQFNHHSSGLGSGARYAEGARGNWPGHRALLQNFKSKDLLGIPWRVAFALQAAGWYLRADIIWHKPNPMPESVTDRPTKSHEYVFLLAKQERYYYDAAAIAEPTDGRTWHDLTGSPRLHVPGQTKQDGYGRRHAGFNARYFSGEPPLTRNKHSVWTVNTQPYDGAHFATMPEALVEPCVLAGSPAGGLVLDPFVGSGTVGAVAERFGRRWVGVDLAYQDLAKERTAQRGLRFEETA